MNTHPHFSMGEFTGSDTAARLRLDNSIPPELIPTAVQTLEMMERIRAHLCKIAGHDVPIHISSGYRSPAVNLAVGSSSTSDHPKACAVDWTAPSFGNPARICRALAPMVSTLGIGQLILEYGRWVHTSTVVPQKSVNRVISIYASGVAVGIVG
jgi:hypothetical protein